MKTAYGFSVGETYKLYNRTVTIGALSENYITLDDGSSLTYSLGKILLEKVVEFKLRDELKIKNISFRIIGVENHITSGVTEATLMSDDSKEITVDIELLKLLID